MNDALDPFEQAVLEIGDAVVYIFKILLFIATIPLVMVYLYFHYQTEKKLRAEGKL